MNAHASVVRHPEWTKHAAVYQLNTRQFTTEGSSADPRVKYGTHFAADLKAA